MKPAPLLLVNPACAHCAGKGWVLGADRWPVECEHCRRHTIDAARLARNLAARNARLAKRRAQLGEG